jgi:hypothetical protein
VAEIFITKNAEPDFTRLIGCTVGPMFGPWRVVFDCVGIFSCEDLPARHVIFGAVP